MSLSFLVPLFLLGLAGTAVPVILHLTRRQRRNVVPFPSLMFLEMIPFREQRRRRIQHWLLLSLRALALALLAVAFARPFLDRTDQVAAGAGGPREVVVILDRSYSMGVSDEFERARARAAQVFDELGPLDRASLVAFGQGAHVLVRSTSDPTRLHAALDTLRVGSGTTRYGPALKAAQTILEESELPAGEVVLVSDFQRSGWTGDEGVHLPAGTVVTPASVARPIPENVLVADVSLLRQSVSGRERVRATARVVRRGGEAARDVPVTLALDGQDLQSRTVTLQADGAATVVFDPFTLSLAHTRGSVRVPDDALKADDALYFVLSPGSALPVLLVEGARAPANASLYLRRALEISDQGRFEVHLRHADGVRPSDLDGVGVAILNDARIDGASAGRLRTFVEGGGGVLVVLGEDATWPASADDVLPGDIGPVEDRAEGRGGRLGYLAYDHPVFEVFSGPRSGDFTDARFFRARAFTQADSAEILARFDDGSVALAEVRHGRGRVLVWTSTLDSFWNDLALQPVYLPFVHRLVEYLSGRVEALPWLTSGQVVDLADRTSLEAAGVRASEVAEIGDGKDLVVLTPSGSSVSMPAEPGPRYLPLEERGFYTVRPPGVDPVRPLVLAVNVDLAESALGRIDPQELAAQVVTPGVGRRDGTRFADAASLLREDQERRQSLWRLILGGAFALLVLETALSNWVSRQRSFADR